MALAERTLGGTATATSSNALTISVTPTGMQTGDWLLASFATIGGAVTHTAPTGWTQISSTQFVSGVGLSRWRRYVANGATEAGPYQWDNGSGANRRMGLAVRCYSGADPANPIDGTPAGASATSATSLTHGTITSSGAGRFWILSTAKGTGLGLTSTMNTPSGFTETADACSSHASVANVNLAVDYKTVGSGATGTQLVDSSDATTQTWVGIGLLLSPAGSQTLTATASVEHTLTVAADAQVISSAPAATVTSGASVHAGGFQNSGCLAPLGVGHNWYAASGGDVSGIHVSADGITWQPSNAGLFFGRHNVVGLEGSATTANRIWAAITRTNAGTGGNAGILSRGTYDPATQIATWTDWAVVTPGMVGGGASHPRQIGRLVALDEANDAAYLGTIDGVWKVTISTQAATQRALAGCTITGIVLDPNDPQTAWVTADADGVNPGVYRIVNLRSGTVATTRYTTLTNPQDLVHVDTGTTRYVFVAGQAQGIRRGTVAAADISTWTWADVTNNYNLGGNGASKIDGLWSGGTIKLIVSNAGQAQMLSSGGYSNDGGTTWVNEATGWTVNMVPVGETARWWLADLLPSMMLGGAGYDCSNPRFDRANPNRIYVWGRSGVWRSTNGGGSWQPAIRHMAATVAWTVAASPTGNGAVVGDGDWTFLSSPDGFTAQMPYPSRPGPGTGMGVAFASDGTICVVAAGETSTGAGGEVWRTTNPFLANPTWADLGFSAASVAPCHGAAVGLNAAGTEIVMTVQSGNLRRKVGTGAPTTVQTGIGIGNMNPHFCWPSSMAGGAAGQYVYLSANDGLWRSSDYGATWTQVLTYGNNNEYTGNLHPDPDNPNILYLTCNDGTVAGTGLFRVNNAQGSIARTKIGPSMTDPGPCAVDPVSGVVYVCVQALEPGGQRLYASPANVPTAATTFLDITDPQWAASAMTPADMCATRAGVVLMAAKEAGYYVATRAGSVPVNPASATITLGTGSDIVADATVVPLVANIVQASATVQVGTPVLSGYAQPTGTATTPAGDVVDPWFNGTWWPNVQLRFGLSGTLDPGPGYLHLGTGPGFGTAMLGGTTWATITNTDIRSISMRRGKDGPLDPATPGTATIVLNNLSGDYDPDNPASPYYGALDVGIPIDIRAERPPGTIWRRFYGEVTGITLDAGTDPTVTLTCADGLEKLGRTQLTGQNIPVGDGDTSGGRVNRILNDAGYPSVLRSVATGYTIVAPSAYGDFALELLRKTEGSEFGLLFCDGAGNVVFYDRHQAATAPRSTTVQAVVADTDAPGAVGMVDLELDYSRDRVWNDVHITREAVPHPTLGEVSEETQPDDQPVEQVATDTASIATLGTLSLPGDVGQVLRQDEDAHALAEYLVARYKTGRSRVRKITIDALRKDLWDILLPLTLLDRVQVIRNYGPRTILEELLIQGWTEEITSDPAWTLTLDTMPALTAPTLWRLGTSAFGSGKLGW